MIIGYLRVSTGKQHLANQKEEILRFAAGRDITIDKWVTEIVSGKKNEKERKLGALLKKMKAGDTLIVTEISRLSRTMTDIMGIMGKCLKKEIKLYTTKEGYSFDDSINSKVLCFAFGLVAEIERNLISMRTKEALALRRLNGITLGRKKGSYTKRKILQEHREEIIRMLDNDISVNVICRDFGISRETFNNFRKADREVNTALAMKNARTLRQQRT
ncbi:MAG TPA: recombinase family protein [Candidatus Coprenecus stercoravium]|uniref:Recombinase family protein n=1 Tax=Candidatus Coprenecus stercoravium TaxID=2840735 RepID=A0A9D2KAM1_9BACT|nr:recombinase family protein [Candidatus Coprenecus stercoravium]